MSPIDQTPRCLTPRELAGRWRCRLAVITTMIRDGRLSAININGRVRILPESVEAAESGTLAVRPRPKREPIPAEVRAILED